MSEQQNQITIFTDGASRGNPGPGGFGAVIATPDLVIELGGHEENTTNNRMEMKAVVEALRRIDEGAPVLVYTDSSYLLNGITKWVHGWQKNGWKTRAGDDVKNADLWQELVEQVSRLRQAAGRQTRNAIDWQLLEGHVGIIGNERADEIATAFADGKDSTLYHGPLAQYPRNVYDVSHDTAAREKKRNGKKGSAGSAYSYVSMVDDEIQTHQTWPECAKRVKGHNAWFRKATSKQEEREIIDRFKRET